MPLHCRSSHLQWPDFCPNRAPNDPHLSEVAPSPFSPPAASRAALHPHWHPCCQFVRLTVAACSLLRIVTAASAYKLFRSVVAFLVVLTGVVFSSRLQAREIDSGAVERTHHLLCCEVTDCEAARDRLSHRAVAADLPKTVQAGSLHTPTSQDIVPPRNSLQGSELSSQKQRCPSRNPYLCLNWKKGIGPGIFDFPALKRLGDPTSATYLT